MKRYTTSDIIADAPITSPVTPSIFLLDIIFMITAEIIEDAIPIKNICRLKYAIGKMNIKDNKK